MKSIKEKLTKVYLWGIVIAPFLLFLLPADHFDHGQSICLSVLLAGIECYACGMTRGVMHMLHLDFAAAWEFNKLTFIVVPLLFLYWLRCFYVVQNLPTPKFLDKIMNLPSKNHQEAS